MTRLRDVFPCLFPFVAGLIITLGFAGVHAYHNAGAWPTWPILIGSFFANTIILAIALWAFSRMCKHR